MSNVARRKNRRRFQDIWARMIEICVAELSWETMVDFRAHDWPAMNAGKLPDQMGMSDYVQLSGQIHTAMTVTLRTRKVELIWYPTSEIWIADGYVRAGDVDWRKEISWSSIEGRLVRGIEKLGDVTSASFEWLKQGE